MGILTSSVSLTRYRVQEEVDNELLRQVPEKLKQNAFLDIDNTSDERSFGWVNIDNMLDNTWSVSPPEKGEMFAFALRLDTRRIPPAVLKKHMQIAVERELEIAKEQGRNFVSRARKKELKEQVELRLRTKTLPIPAVFEVIWNPSENRVYLGTTNAKVRALFEDMFQDTFELRLDSLSPFFLALDVLGEEAVSRLENLEPTVFI